MRQQGLLAGRADAGNIVQRVFRHLLFALGPVAANGKAVCLVAQALEIVEHRILLRQFERRLARQVEGFAAGIALGALGDGGDGDVGHAQFFGDLHHGRQLPLAAIDQDQVGHGCAFLALPDQARQAATQHGLHHREIIVGGRVVALHVEAAIMVFLKAVRSRHDHRAQRVRALDMRVVIDLDALGDVLQFENPLHAL
jgi:hypothetical protein